jgi:hypothetical protein
MFSANRFYKIITQISCNQNIQIAIRKSLVIKWWEGDKKDTCKKRFFFYSAAKIKLSRRSLKSKTNTFTSSTWGGLPLYLIIYQFMNLLGKLLHRVYLKNLLRKLLHRDWSLSDSKINISLKSRCLFIPSSDPFENDRKKL